MFSSRLGERKENDSNKNVHISQENNRDLFDSFEFLSSRLLTTSPQNTVDYEFLFDSVFMV